MSLVHRQQGRPPTIRDVAVLAGVSIKTVSRVVRGECGVSIERTRAVQDAIALLDYQQNTVASTLRRADHRTAAIGLLLEDVANPFSSTVHRAIEDVARQQGILIFAGSSDRDPKREQEMLHAFLCRRVDGLIVASTIHDQSVLASSRHRTTPLVFVDRPSAAMKEADHVTSDNRGGAMKIVQHLVAHGHRRIAFLGDQRTIWTAEERYTGYIEGLATAGIELQDHLVRRDLVGAEAANDAVRDLMSSDRPPTALFTAQNLLTIGALRALQALEASRRIALIGFDDIPLAELLDPPVSVIAQNPEALGRTAAELLLARLADDSRAPQHVVVPVQFIPRGSGEITASS